MQLVGLSTTWGQQHAFLQLPQAFMVSKYRIVKSHKGAFETTWMWSGTGSAAELSETSLSLVKPNLEATIFF